MALTRKFLTALGIEADKVDEIITAHSETVDALKTERDKYKEDALKFPEVQKELDELKKASEGLDGKNPYEVKYNELKEEYEKYKADVEHKEILAKKVDAYKALLKKVGVSDKRIDAILRVTDLSGEDVTDEGLLKNEKALEENIKNEWSDFIVKEGTKGAEVENPSGNTGGKSMTRAEIMKIRDASERQKAIAENIELFQ